MEDKTNDNLAENNDTEGFDYEELINDFSSKDKSVKDDTAQSGHDLDSIALSELLEGDTGEKSESESSIDEQDTQAEDEFAEIFSELDEEARDSVQEESPDEVISEQPEEKETEETVSEAIIGETEVVLDESLDSSGGDYAAVLSQIEGADTSETVEKSDAEVTAVDMDETAGLEYLEEVSSEGAQTGSDTEEVEITGEISTLEDEEIQAETVEEPILSESELTESDITFTSDESDEEEPEEVVVSDEQKSEEAEEDFLGLGAISGAEKPGASSEGKWGATTEVLFEGVEMDFDAQITDVTLAEVLLAQGEKEDSAKLFNRIASQKGMTHWVAKRLNLVGSKSTDDEAGD